MPLATPISSINMDAYGLTGNRMNDLTSPIHSKNASIRLWMRPTGDQKIIHKAMDTFLRSTGLGYRQAGVRSYPYVSIFISLRGEASPPVGEIQAAPTAEKAERNRTCTKT